MHFIQSLIFDSILWPFQVGELMSGSHPILAKNIHVGLNKMKMLFLLNSSKTHKGDKPQVVKIKGIKQGKDTSTFPFRLLKDFIALQPPILEDGVETFFIFRDRSPVKPDHFRAMLKSSLCRCAFDASLYQVHSMHAGCACDLLKAGVSVETIKKLGWWKSNAVYAYLKC